MDTRIASAEFLYGAPTVNHLKQNREPEIAVLGRSNCGKSSFLNLVCNKRGLARSSSTPGRTQEINIFSVRVMLGKGKPKAAHIADFPGFGFAKFSKTQREAVSKMTVDYLEQRDSLALACLLNDCRRDPGTDELSLTRIFLDRGIPFLIIMTKCDKLSNSQLIKQKRSICEQYGISEELLVCSGTGFSIKEFWKKALDALNSFHPVDPEQDDTI